MIEIMQRELLTLTDEIMDTINEGSAFFDIDKDDYSITYRIVSDYTITENQHDYDTPPEQTYKRDYTSCNAQITIFDDGTEISKSGWEDLTEFMNQEITHYEL